MVYRDALSTRSVKVTVGGVDPLRVLATVSRYGRAVVRVTRDAVDQKAGWRIRIPDYQSCGWVGWSRIVGDISCDRFALRVCVGQTSPRSSVRMMAAIRSHAWRSLAS